MNLRYLQSKDEQEQQSNTITSDSVSPEHLKAMELEMAKIKVELQVANGKLCKQLPAHHKYVSCLAFSDDNSLIISGAIDGVINVWLVIGLLDMVDNVQEDMSSICLHSLYEHRSLITDLVVSSGGSSSVLISYSLDCTCKVWRLGNGTLQQTFTFLGEIKAIMVDPRERLLFVGSVDGTIFVNELDIGLQGTSDVATENQ